MMQPSTSTIISLSLIVTVLLPLLNGDDALLPQRLKIIPQICANKDYDVVTAIHKLVQTGRTSKARLVANECVLLLNNAYASSKFSSLFKCCSGSSDIIIEAYKTSKELQHEHEDFLQSIIDNLNKEGSNTTIDSARDSKCVHSETLLAEIEMDPFASNIKDDLYTHGSTIIEQWNACCSYWRSDSSTSKCILDDFCCEIVQGTDHHLILPALREPYIKLKNSNSTEFIEIEQDGLLQLYDVGGVLWPAGYLLGLCLSNPVKCGVEEIFDAINNATRPYLLELGTGVGFAAIALSKTVRDQSNSPLVVATDVSKSALDLTVTNAYKNGVKEMMVAIEVDYRDVNSLRELKSTINLSDGYTSKKQQGFDIIIGSSLQSLFDGTQHKNAPLWLTLDTLLSRNNLSATVILSHVRSGSERIQVPDESIPFELVRRISGDEFNMKTRDGNNSDFELVVLRRHRQSY